MPKAFIAENIKKDIKLAEIIILSWFIYLYKLLKIYKEKTFIIKMLFLTNWKARIQVYQCS